MIIFRQVEFRRRQNLGSDFAFNFFGDLLFARQGQSLLRLIVIENCIHILPRPDAAARMVAGPEHRQQLFIGNAARIEIHLDRLRMIPQGMISGVFSAAAGIADPGAYNAGNGPEPGLNAPKSPQGKSGCLGHLRNLKVQGRYSAAGTMSHNFFLLFGLILRLNL